LFGKKQFHQNMVIDKKIKDFRRSYFIELEAYEKNLFKSYEEMAKAKFPLKRMLLLPTQTFDFYPYRIFFSYPQEFNRWFTGFVPYYLDYAKKPVNLSRFSRYMYFNGFLYRGVRGWKSEISHYSWQEKTAKMHFKDVTVGRFPYVSARIDLRSRRFFVFNKKKALYLQLLAEYFGRK